VLGRQAVLHLTHARELCTDLPFHPFPVSRPDTSSGGTTLAVTALAFAYGPLRRQPAPAAATPAAASGEVALLVDVYLYQSASGMRCAAQAAHRVPSAPSPPRRGAG
jgi:hypothetical protein